MNYQLAELRAEYGVLARTEEILKGKDETFQHQLVSVIVLGSTLFLTLKASLSRIEAHCFSSGFNRNA